VPSSGALNIANTAPVVQTKSGAEAKRNRSTTQLVALIEASSCGTVNDDVLALKDPRFQRTDFCKVILGSAWAS
jgi:hypothetical protein